MVTNQVKADALISVLNHSVILFSLLIVSAWLFVAFSYYVSWETRTDWFSRSGSIMGSIGAVVTFRGLNVYQHKLELCPQGGLVSLPREIELAIDPPRSFRVPSYCGYLTGVVGTGTGGTGTCIWSQAAHR